MCSTELVRGYLFSSPKSKRKRAGDGVEIRRVSIVVLEEQVDENSRSEDGQGCYWGYCYNEEARLEWSYILPVPWPVVVVVSFEEEGDAVAVEEVDRLAWFEVVAVGIDH